MTLAPPLLPFPFEVIAILTFPIPSPKSAPAIGFFRSISSNNLIIAKRRIMLRETFCLAVENLNSAYFKAHIATPLLFVFCGYLISLPQVVEKPPSVPDVSSHRLYQCLTVALSAFQPTIYGYSPLMKDPTNSSKDYSSILYSF